MSKTNPFQFNWHNTLGALAITIAACVDIPATATPIKDTFEVAQVGIHSNIQSPVPLNLRPRVIIGPSSHHHHHGYSYPIHYPHYNHHRRHNRHYNHRRSRGSHKKIIIISPGGSRHHHHHKTHYGNYNRRRSHSRGGAYIRIGY